MKLAKPAVLALVLALLAPLARAEIQRPGSLLVFPVHERDGGLTVLSVTNASPTRSVRLLFRYLEVTADPADPLHPLHCSFFFAAEVLTPNDTVSRLVECQKPAGGDGGFVVVTAQDPASGCNVSHDWLVGSELVVSAQGASYALPAYAFEALVPAGSCTDADGDGRADLDGVEYEPAPDVLFLDGFAAALNPRLVLLPLLPDPRGREVSVRLDVYNDAEFPLSLTFSFECWMDVRLRDLSPIFTDAYLRGTPNDPRELDLDCDLSDDFETGWVRIEASSASGPSGSIARPAILGAVVGGPGTLEPGRLLWGQGTRATGEL